MICAILMFTMGDKSEIAFAIWGIMFMAASTIINIMGSPHHGS